jgi:hypothetical protein
MQIVDIHHDKRGLFIINGSLVFAAEFLSEGSFQSLLEILIEALP